MRYFYFLNPRLVKIFFTVAIVGACLIASQPALVAPVYADDYYDPFGKGSSDPADDTGLIPCEGVDCEICDIFTLIDNVKDFIVFDIASPLAAIMLIYGGILLLTSGGNEKNKSKGTKTVTAAIIGTLLVFAAWLIVNTILGALANDSFKDSWNGFDGC